MDEREQREFFEEILRVLDPLAESVRLLTAVVRDELAKTPARPPELEVLLADHKRAIDSLAEATPKPPPELRLID